MDYTNMAAGSGPANKEDFRFTGTGGEYFRIWIVNLLLTILTLGIYSAWAKVRRLQYFHRNTILAGSGFDYHGSPMAILKGRLLIVAFAVAYQVLVQFAPFAALGLMLVMMLALPWMIRQALRFRAWNSSYRGLRFHFSGSLKGAYGAYILRPFLGMLTVGLAMPWAMQRKTQYQINHLGLGQQKLDMQATVGSFYLLALKVLGLLILAMAVVGGVVFLGGSIGSQASKLAAVKATIAGVLAFYGVLFFVVGPFVWSRFINLVWNHVAIGQMRFVSDVRARGILWIVLTNFLGMIVTLGFFWPWAMVRMARYRIEHMALENAEDLDHFVGQAQQEVAATGDAAAEWLDLDLGL